MVITRSYRLQRGVKVLDKLNGEPPPQGQDSYHFTFTIFDFAWYYHVYGIYCFLILKDTK